MAERDYAAVAGAAGKRAMWAARRVGEVSREQGVGEATRRGVAVLQRRRAQRVESRALELPEVDARAGAWPPCLVILANRDIVQCYRYRVAQKVEMAQSIGLPIIVIDPRESAEALSLIQLGSSLLVYRQPWSKALARCYAEARRLGLPIIYETDDLMYRQDMVAANPNLASLPAQLRKSVIKDANAHLASMRHADHVIGSTEPLVEDMQKEVKGRAWLIENGLDSDIEAMQKGIDVDPVVTKWRESHVDEVVVTYGSGSRAHDSDLAAASEGIRIAMERDPRIRLRLIGPLLIPENLQSLASRIQHVDAVPLGDYLRYLAMSHITIAPLDSSPFNRFKSQVKYLEAGVLHRPMVASPTVYSRYVLNGRTALLVTSAAEWADAIASLAGDPERRDRLATAANEHVQRWRLDHLPSEQFRSFAEAVMSGELRGAA